MFDNDKPDQVNWNLAGTTAEEIAKHLADASDDYKNGKLAKCFYELKLIKNRVIQNLKQEERDTLKKMETKIENMIALDRVTNSEQLDNRLQEKLKRIYKKKTSSLLNEVDSYNEIIMDMLQKYGFLFQKKDDKTKMIA